MSDNFEGNGWNEWRRYIVEELKRLSKQMESIRENMLDKKIITEIKEQIKENRNSIIKNQEKISVMSKLFSREDEILEERMISWRWVVEKFGPSALMAIIVVVAFLLISSGQITP